MMEITANVTEKDGTRHVHISGKPDELLLIYDILVSGSWVDESVGVEHPRSYGYDHVCLEIRHVTPV